MHPGHLDAIKRVLEENQRAVIGIQSDPTIDRAWKETPVQTLYERFCAVRAVTSGAPASIIPYTTEWELAQMLALERVTHRYLDEQYQHEDYTGKELHEELGIQIVWVPRKHAFSSTLMRGRLRTP